MKSHVCLLTILVALVCHVYVQPAWAFPTAPDAEKSRALSAQGDAKEERTHTIAYQRIRSAHKTPICYETLLRPSDTAVPDFPFQVRENQTLAYSLEEFVKNTQHRFEYKRVRGVLCILPSNPERLTNAFDTKVSLDLKKVSAWEAFKALGKAMNANKPSGHPGIRILPGAVGVGARPPKALLDERRISLQLKNVSAREAACAIIAAAPFQMSFLYEHGVELDRLSIDAFKKGEMWSKGHLSREENKFWLQEIEDASRP